MEWELEKNTPNLSEIVWSIGRLALGNQMLWVRRLWVRLSGSCFGLEDIFFEEALLNKLFQVLLEDIFAVENHLLSLAIRFRLLFLRLLFHLVEHLKEMVFALLRWLDTGGEF